MLEKLGDMAHFKNFEFKFSSRAKMTLGDTFKAKMDLLPFNIILLYSFNRK